MSHPPDPRCQCSDCREAAKRRLAEYWAEKPDPAEIAAYEAQEAVGRAQRAVVRAERRLIAAAMREWDCYTFSGWTTGLGARRVELRAARLALRRAKRRARK